MKQRFSKRTRLVSALLTLAMVFTFLPFSAFAATGDVEINSTNFPDYNFRAYLYNEFGISLSESERNTVEMNLGPNYFGGGRNIENLKGIEYFTKLEILECLYNKITELDTSSNSELKYLTCNRNQLTQLNVSSNNALISLTCGDNQLTALDVSGNPNLTLLSCRNNQLTSLDLSHNDKLMSLDCDDNQLTFLDLSKNVKLEKAKFTCSGNKYPITIDATKRTFNLNDLPTGFDVNKTSGWVGGDVVSNTLKVDPGADRVTYIYNCGNGLSAEFELTVNDGTTGGGSTGGGTVPPVTPPSGGGSTGGTTPGGPTGGETGGSSGGGGGGGAIIVVAGAAAVGLVGYGIYNYVAERQLQALLPEGAASPENRAQTALLLWNTAGRPEPAAQPAFPDVADPETAKAAQWCVEHGLMNAKLRGRFAPDGSSPAYKTLNAYRQLVG